MYLGLLAMSPTQTIPFAHNLTPKMAEMVIADFERRGQGKQVKTFTHALLHDEAIDPYNCPGCIAAINEKLDMLDEEEAVRERQSRAATPPPQTSQERPVLLGGSPPHAAEEGRETTLSTSGAQDGPQAPQ